MTEMLFLEDMYLKEFEAIVEEVAEGRFLILDRTAFYPKSGGVSFDTGIIIRKSDGKRFNVISVSKSERGILHEVDEEGIREGETVHAELNWDRRYELMRYHTAAHIISGIFWNQGGLKISGNELDLGGGRMDFTLEDFDKQRIEDFVYQANQIVEGNLPVDVYYISRKELETDPSLVKLLAGFPENIEHVRIVEIRGFDKQPDGGCHVQATGEVGKIKLTKTKNKGKSNRRMYFELE
jgi:misacylated tRNA(Ala) deacylase